MYHSENSVGIENTPFAEMGGAPGRKPQGKRDGIDKRDGQQINNSNESLYMKNLLEMKVVLSPMEIGENTTKQNITHIISSHIEGKCIREGYVKPKSVKITQYSCGLVKGEFVEFSVLFECLTCIPVEGTWIKQCKVRSITKAGIHADAYDNHGNIPVTVFVARDHFNTNSYFNSIKENDMINIKVIGNRFELNDECIEVLGNLIYPASEKK